MLLNGLTLMLTFEWKICRCRFFRSSLFFSPNRW